LGEEALLASRGVEVIVGEDPKCYDLMQAFIKKNPEEWNEDIGEE
jgi:cytosine deaminase